jgi:hypothetical protein
MTHRLPILLLLPHPAREMEKTKELAPTQNFREQSESKWRLADLKGTVQLAFTFSFRCVVEQSPYFQTFMEPRNRFQGMNSASLCSLAGPYDNPIPNRFLAPIDCLKIPAQVSVFSGRV